MVAIVQEAITLIPQSTTGTISLPSAPTVGARLILIGWCRNDDTVAVPAGFTQLGETYITTGSSAIMIASRIVQSGDTEDYAAGKTDGVNRGYWLVELDTAASIGDIVTGRVTGDTTPGPAAPPSGGFVIGAFAVMADITGREVHIATPATEVDASYINAPTFGPFASLGYGTDELPATATADAAAYHYTGWVAASITDAPIEPSEPPPYVPPPPGNAIVEIYTTDPDGPKWDVAEWDEAVWAGEGWQDVTPESVSCDVEWGVDDPALGVLARPRPGSWTILGYDPDRNLDPQNDDGPYVGQLVEGLPIRIRHRGIVCRTGTVESIVYSYQTHTLRIRATDALGRLQARVPEDAVLTDTLWARATDVLTEAGITDVGIRRGRPGYDTPLSAAPDGELTAFDHLSTAAEEVLAILWAWRDDRLAWRHWSALLDRGTVIGADELIDLLSIRDGRGQYTRVLALDEDGVTVTERVSTPTPRSGRRTYERTDTTIDSGDWADRVLLDREASGQRFVLGEIRPLTAARVETYATIEAGEVVTIDTDDVTETVVVLGGRFRVAMGHYDDGELLPEWRWTFQVARVTGTGSALLVDDDDGYLLVSDDDPDTYLVAEV